MITITNTITIVIITLAIAIITISPGPNASHTHLQLMGSGQQIPMENLSRRSALPTIQLSTFPAESKAAIVNTMTVRHRGISSQ
jgi:hypothetical protein